ncbi:hypothetical protein TanjilG_27049 [Lupinus angustifolius]|uniref:Poly(A) polymerase n=1 Tax=Lupinus angustifolius TaxID=3871 RepID=A0A4P1QVX7_LUPAN|nr:hypothetical protein TanjilG_27049 [Lupinus angustifolius]
MELESYPFYQIPSGLVFDPPPPFPVINHSLPPPPPSGLLLPFHFNPSLFFDMDHQRTMSLIQFVNDEGLVPSQEEEDKRKKTIHKLKKIVYSWIKRVAWKHQLPKHQIAVTSATILTYGSYGLGVHSQESDIDALCVAPFFVNIAEDVFVVLHNMLKNRPEVSEIQCVKSAKVPLIRLKFDGISIDLPYARLRVLYVPENVDILNPFFMRSIDDTSWKCLSGVRANKCILQLVPNVEKFQSMLRILKFWAKRRGLYGALLGYLGGIHLAILAAYVCQMHPDATLNTLIMNFFRTFAFWHWPKPVSLQEGMLQASVDAIEPRPFSLMPILLPSTSNSYEYCHSNITNSTCYRIKSEFIRGHNMTKPFPYSKRYSKFVKIYLSASDQCGLGNWVGLVKSRFRGLFVILEELQGFCDPNPTEYVENEKGEPNVVFYWGLHPGDKNSLLDIELIEGEFMKIIVNGYEGSHGMMKLSIMIASQLPKNAQFDDPTMKVSDNDNKRSPVNSQHQHQHQHQHHPHFLVCQIEPSGEVQHLSFGG